MKKFWLFLLTVGIFSCVWAQSQTTMKKVVKYVKENDVQMLSKPLGKQIAAMAKGTECTVLREQGELVQVQITGWIARADLADTQPMRALHIMVVSRVVADDIFTQLRAGRSFEDLAKEKSILPNAAKGGDLGYFNKGDFDPKIEAAILVLQANEISPIVEFNGKFNIFKRIE
jgi:parvulin-like peptidyl-prolyl isomerase